MANEQQQKLSEAMKLRHAEGRAWNIGQSRWNNQPSYPEQWFMTVMENEGFGDGYIRELPFGRFSLDFAWPGKKLCIEIDGEQHDRCEKQKSRDIAKDQLLAEHGWQVLRLKWKEVYHNPKHWIAVAKEFYSCGNLQ